MSIVNIIQESLLCFLIRSKFWEEPALCSLAGWYSQSQALRLLLTHAYDAVLGILVVGLVLFLKLIQLIKRIWFYSTVEVKLVNRESCTVLL